MDIKCETCGKMFRAFPSSKRRFCSKKCSGVYLSQKYTGVPRLYCRGENNPNYGGAYTHDPDIWDKIVTAARNRGQPWSEQDRKDHSERMRSPECNKMIGKQHTESTKKVLSQIQKSNWAEGKYENAAKNRKRVSRAERAIQEYIVSIYPDVEFQKHFNGISYQYDFYVPSIGLIIEYQGDYWHFNPRKYKSGSYVNRPHGGKVISVLVDTIWERDLKKKESAENIGLMVVYFWEMDYKKFGIDFLKTLIPAT